MKLSFIFLFGLCLQAAANGYSQGDVRISITLTDAPLNTAFSEVEKKSGFRIFYSNDDLPEKVLISVDAKNEYLSDVLTRILDKTKLNYKILDNKVIVISSAAGAYAEVQLTGRVTGANNEPLSGVSINVKQSQIGTITDAQGNFSIKIPDNVAPVLIISYVGYVTREVVATNKSKLTVRLDQVSGGLNEVVVVGYGKQKKASVTAAVSSLAGDQITKAPVANISNTLGGRVSGVISRQSSGAPGDDEDRIQIRGIGTTGNSAPLIVVNGIPMDYNNLNPNEIETITILKDAAAVAPYGLAGANGVILVTTKRGKEGKFSLSYDANYGIQRPTNMPKFLNSYDYARLLSDANQNVGNPRTYTDADLEKFRNGSDPDHYPNTDWVKEILNYKAPITRHTLSMTGGSDKVRFYSNLGYLYQEGVVSPINFKRYNMTINVDADVTNTTTVSLDINSALTKNEAPSGQSGTSIFTNVTEIPPIYPLRFSNGLAAHAMWPQIYESGYSNNNDNILNAKLQLEQQIPFIPGLSLKGAFAYNKNYGFDKEWTLPVTFYSLNASNQYVQNPAGPPTPTLTQAFAENQRIVLQGYITYQRTFGKHSVNALGVYERQDGLSNSFSAGRINYAVMLDELSSGSSNKNDFNNAGSSSSSAQVGYVYQVNYAYSGKYLLGLSGRYNGHYYFAPGKRFTFFPAVSLGWRVSEENFIKDNYDWIDNLKLRGSYGSSGNLAGNPFQYLTSYGLRNSYVFGGTAPYQTQGIFENAQSNPNITWETAVKANVGLDASFWKGKLGIVLDFFKERRSDMLINPSSVVPAEYGIGISQINAGEMENQGMEFTVTSDHRFSRSFSVNAAFNFSYATNKLLQTFENSSTYNNPNRRQTGRPWNSQFGLQSVGLYQLSDFESNGTTLKAGQAVPTFGPVLPGDIKYMDIAGAPGADGKPTAPDGKIDVNDNTLIGDPLFPQIIYGFNLGITWKGLDVTTFWQGAGKASILLTNEVAFPFFNGAKIFEEQTDYWTPANPNASYPRLVPAPVTNNTQMSSFWIRNGNYLRLKTAEIGYSLPPAVMNRIKMRQIRVFVSGQNLLTFSKLKYLDPELGNSRARYYFQQKTYSVGFNIGF